MKRIAAGLSALLWAAGVFAAEPQLREDYPTSYEVVEGDTLWDIAGRFLEQPWQWPEVWQVNPQIENPHLIYPGDIIRLSFVEGVPVITLERAGAGRPEDLPVVKVSPQVRREPLRSPIPAISLEAINSFMIGTRVLDPASLDETPYLVGTERGTLLAANGEIIYARGDWPAGVTIYEVVRPGTALEDPASGERLGIEAELIGEATLVSRQQDRATLRVESVTREIRMGDRFIPRATSVIDTTYFPTPPDFDVDAQILEIGQGLAYGGQWDTLILNVGERENLATGHLLTVQKPDHALPDPNSRETLVFSGQQFASVLIYRVFDRTSLAMVLNSSEPIRMNDRVVSP